jgi:tetratricopeptide (TPR) repeat protein
MPTTDRFWRGVRVWVSYAIAAFAMGSNPAIAQDQNAEWVGKRVITKLRAEFRNGGLDQHPEVAVRGQNRASRIGVVEKVEGGWARLEDDWTGDAGWAKVDSLVLADRAIDYLSGEIRARPTDAGALEMRGFLWNERKEYDRALADYAEAIRIDPRFSDAYVSRGATLQARHEYDLAIADFSEAIRLNSKPAGAYTCRSLAWVLKEEYDKALADIAEAIRLDPGNSLAYHSRGLAWSGKGDQEHALADFSEAIRLDPKAASAYSQRGLIEFTRQNYDRVVVETDQAIKIDPNLTEAYVTRGLARYCRQEYDQALPDFDRAIQLDPDRGLAFYGRGMLRLQKEDDDRALADLSAAIRLSPKFALSYSSRADIWFDRGDYPKAIADYTETIRLAPGSVNALFGRSISQMILERAEAIDGFKAILDTEDGQGTVSPYAVILGHLAAKRAKDEAEARAFLGARAAKLEASTWPFPVVKLLRGELDEAKVLALAANDDERTEARCYLGLNSLLRNRKAEALTHFRWVRDHGSKSMIEYKIAMSELKRLKEPPLK